VEALDWYKPSMETHFAQAEIIIGSDLTYELEPLEPLLKILLSLCGYEQRNESNGEDFGASLVILSYGRERYAHGEFAKLVSPYFELFVVADSYYDFSDIVFIAQTPAIVHMYPRWKKPKISTTFSKEIYVKS